MAVSCHGLGLGRPGAQTRAIEHGPGPRPGSDWHPDPQALTDLLVLVQVNPAASHGAPVPLEEPETLVTVLLLRVKCDRDSVTVTAFTSTCRKQ